MKTFYFFLINLVAVSAFAQTFTYHLRYVPYTQIEECAAEAQLIADRLAREAQVTVENPRCEVTISGTTVIAIDYNSEKALNFVSTVPESFFLNNAFYKTKNECENDLSNQLEIFERETALKSIVHFCYKEGSYSTGYSLRIDAVGNAKNSPQYAYAQTDGSFIYPNEKAAEVRVKDFLRARGITPIHFALRSSGKLVVFFYSNTPLSLVSSTFYSVAGSCQKSLDALNETFSHEQNKIALAYCGSTSNYFPNNLYFIAEQGAFNSQSSIEKFANQASCEKEKDSVVAKYRSVLKVNTIFGMCMSDIGANVYRIGLIYPK